MPKRRPPTGRRPLPVARGSAPEARLVSAMIELAVNDAQARDVHLAAEARRWLLGPGRAWLAWLDVPEGQVLGWIRRLPPPGQRAAA